MDMNRPASWLNDMDHVTKLCGVATAGIGGTVQDDGKLADLMSCSFRTINVWTRPGFQVVSTK
jgi:hypothetical protein